ncbi:MAG: GWxTD domain-containing protein [Bacteroidetes bacterium]|nr:GWxTD domain-containing protein [Bacteroidota bacterium]
MNTKTHSYTAFMILLYCSFTSCIVDRSLSNRDIAYLYNENTYLTCNCLSLNEKDSINVYLKLTIRHKMKGVQARDFKIFYWLTKDYRSSNVILSDTFRLKFELNPDAGSLQHKYISFKIPKSKPVMPVPPSYSGETKSGSPLEGESGKTTDALLIIGIKEVDKYTFIPRKSERFICETPVNFANKFSDRFYLFDKTGKYPLFKNYINSADTIQISDANPASGETNDNNKNQHPISNIQHPVSNTQLPAPSFYIYHYDHNFKPALPPMARDRDHSGSSKTLKIDTVYTVHSNSLLIFPKKGLYFVQQDTNGNDGFSFLVVDDKYPKVTKVKDLIEQLIYITTKEERKRLINSKHPKKALDDFWIDIARNENYARRLIKLYYNRVEFVNRNFTSYKEGWKTDRGMIYIIYGRPEEVYKFDDKEKWIYTRYVINQWDARPFHEELSFTFVHKANIFSGNHYELIRYPSYQRKWYSEVEQWREGMFR